MKILMINSVCGIRSTGRICTDLAVALEAHGHVVKIAYGREHVPEQYQRFTVKIGNDLTVKAHGALARLYDADGRGSILATKKFISWVKKYDPDVVHLHNIHGYYINTNILFNYLIENKKRVIWTLHDMWSFTGHSGTCDIRNCERWRTGCYSCPAYRGYPEAFIDRSKENYVRKQDLFSSVDDLTMVAPSRWLAGLVADSYLSNKRIEVIPNGIDLNTFYPLKNDFKKIKGIEDKILLLGSVHEGTGNCIQNFCKLVDNIDDRFAIALVGLNKKQLNELPDQIIGIEQTNSLKELSFLYSAADVVLDLTREDNPSAVISNDDHNMSCQDAYNPLLGNNQNGRCILKGSIDLIIEILMNNESFKSGTPNPPIRDSEIKEKQSLTLSSNGYFQTRRKYAVIGKNLVLGVAAFWGERKGLDDFIRLAKELPEEYVIIMVGVSEEIKKLLPERVISIERTDSQEELKELYGSADVFVNPTIQDNYPTVNLEAVACGTPVITYQTGGSPESAYTPSCVVEQKDYEALKKCILSKSYENALRIDNPMVIGKELMTERYEALYLLNNKD